MTLREDVATIIARTKSKGYSDNTKRLLMEGLLPLADEVLDRIGIVELEHNPGGILQVHSRINCEGTTCAVHNPSNHSLRYMRQTWNPMYGMRRLCVHGFEHPDPDHITYLYTKDELDAIIDAIHACDGCCDQEGGTSAGEPGA